MGNERSSNYFVNSVAKGFEVLKAFDSNSAYLTLSDLEKRTGINKATVRRFALTLVDLGFLKVKENTFYLSPKVLDLAAHYLETLSLPDLAHPILESMAAKVHESTNLAILDEAEVVYVSRVNGAKRIIGANLRVGSRLPYYATSLGKALVAWLPADERKRVWDSTEIKAYTNHTITDFNQFEAHLEMCRNQGYAEGNAELEQGLRSIAMPIFNRNGEPIAAVNISTTTIRTTDQKIKEIYLPVLKEGAEELNRIIKFNS